MDSQLGLGLGKPLGYLKVSNTGKKALVYPPLQGFFGKAPLREGGPVPALDLGVLTSAMEQEIAGILGMTFLRDYVVQLDFDEGMLRLLDPNSPPEPGWGEALPLHYSPDGLPYVRGRVLGEDVQFQIDTGANGSGALEVRLLKTLFEEYGGRPSEDTVMGLFAEDRVVASGRIAELSLGRFSYRDLSFRSGIKSKLGLGFLSRHLVTFDFPHATLYLKKGRSFASPEEEDMSGIDVARVSGNAVVREVLPDGPAEKAGIRAGDNILTLNGREAASLNIWAIRRLLRSGDGKEIRMTVRRGDRTFEVSFRLEKGL